MGRLDPWKASSVGGLFAGTLEFMTILFPVPLFPLDSPAVRAYLILIETQEPGAILPGSFEHMKTPPKGAQKPERPAIA